MEDFKAKISPKFFDALDFIAKSISKLPVSLRNLRASFIYLSMLLALLMIFIINFAFKANGIATAIFSCFFVAVLIFSNIWFVQRVLNPLLGLHDSAKRISDGSYGSLSEKMHDDEIGTLTDAINEMSLKIDESSKMQTGFISSISHELRTPLAAITGWSETLLYEENLEPTVSIGLDIILRESTRLAGMVGDLLEFTRINDGRFTLSLERVNLCAEIDDIVFTYQKLLETEHITLKYSYPEEDLPFITGDPYRLKQVVYNILDNAVKHGACDDIDVKIEAQGEYVITSVRDYGAGISERDLPRIKEKFYKGDSTKRGSGIGLAVCDEIVTRHGGALLISNAEGGGALIKIVLPIETQ